METVVYAFFEGKQGSEHERCIVDWNVYYWPAVVVRALLPQALQHEMVEVPARLLKERLPRAIEVVETAARSEETETAMDDAERLMWEVRDFVRRAEAHQAETARETLIRPIG